MRTGGLLNEDNGVLGRVLFSICALKENGNEGLEVPSRGHMMKSPLEVREAGHIMLILG